MLVRANHRKPDAAGSEGRVASACKHQKAKAHMCGKLVMKVQIAVKACLPELAERQALASQVLTVHHPLSNAHHVVDVLDMEVACS